MFVLVSDFVALFPSFAFVLASPSLRRLIIPTKMKAQLSRLYRLVVRDSTSSNFNSLSNTRIEATTEIRPAANRVGPNGELIHPQRAQIIRF